MFQTLKILRWFFVILGTTLLIINLAGVAINEKLWPKPVNGRYAPDYQPYSREMKKFMEKGAMEKPEDFAKRINNFIYTHTVHYFPQEATLGNLAETSAPFLWNWAIWLRGFWALLTREEFILEFCDAEMGLRRGYGLCSQRSLILQNVLRNNGIKAKATKLYGHVVCMIETESGDILLDPDYGFSIPHSLDYLHANPEAIRDYTASPEIISMYIPILESGKWVERKGKEYGCMDDRWLLKMTIIKWAVPFLLLLCAIFCHRAVRKNPRP